MIDATSIAIEWDEFLRKNDRAFFPSSPHFIKHPECLLEDPFEVSFETCKKFSETEMILFQLRARNYHEEMIEDGLAERKADWILVVGGNIVDTGARGRPQPTGKELMELGKKHNRYPFVFFRCVVIEGSGGGIDVTGAHSG